ncbi:hypothetical protein [Lactiplantibacillus mudanjiangensis]|uniref:hypothetical protein n=1 Tax=Lactiplantibacillus mudanjiangensis TaxID=1296538 RepID=UPI0013EF315C
MNKGMVSFSNRHVYFYIGYAIYFSVLIFTLVYPYEQNMKAFIVRFLVLPFSFLLYFIFLKKNNGVHSFFRKFSLLIHIIAVVALFFWIFGSLLHWINASSSLVINWGTTYKIPSFFGVYFETQNMQVFGQTIVRNTAIFTEPPMFSYIIIITLLGDLFYLKAGFRDIGFLFIVILTSGSAFGTSIVVLIAAYCYVRRLLVANGYYFTRQVKQIISITGCISIVLVIFVLYNRIVNGGGSVSIHMQDFVCGYQAWINHPFIGNGLNNFQSIADHMSVIRLGSNGNSGISSGIVYVLAYGGIYWALFYILPILLDLKYNLMKKSDFVIVDIIFLLLIIFVEVYNLTLTLLLVMLIWQHLLDKDDRQLNWVHRRKSISNTEIGK